MNAGLKLGVNIDHVATLRRARGTTYPVPAQAVPFCVRGGADSITIHLREDRRHIVDADLARIADERLLPLNLEMANVPEMVGKALEHFPDEVCLVPERRQELTTEGGLDAAGTLVSVSETVRTLAGAGISVSLFIDPDERQIEAAVKAGAPCVEFHTGTFCDAPPARAEEEIRRLVRAARLAHRAGLQVNAGHGINLANIDQILRMPHLDTLNIGHSIIAEAVFQGLEKAVRDMHEAMRRYQGGEVG